MEQPRILICNLSPLHLVDSESSPLKTVPEEHAYTFVEDGQSFSYTGRQTNQAPVKCLIDRAYYGDRIPVTTMVNLFSSECEKEHEPFLNEFGDEDESSDENYLIDSICEYCERSEIPDPEFQRIPYDPINPAASLAQLVSFLEQPNAIVDIDVTGGLRDASVLISLAIQAIRERSVGTSGSGGITIGRIVYANHRDKTITTQKKTYALVDLANAIAAFTTYGKADFLCAYFEEHGASGTTKKLCGEFKRFSEQLALCNTSLEPIIENIESLLDTLEEVPRNELAPSELLLVSLIPSLRSNFIQNNGCLTLELAKWCIERQMLQQALAILREQIPTILIDSKLIGLRNGARPADIEQLCCGESFKEKNGRHSKPIVDNSKLSQANDMDSRVRNLEKCLLNTRDVINEEYATMRQGKDKALSDALTCFRYVWLVRNSVMHGSEADAWACKLLLEATKRLRIGWKYLKPKEKRGKNGKIITNRKGEPIIELDESCQSAQNLTWDLKIVVDVLEKAYNARD